ncbi:hypothetical protein [Sandarakinorhabdus sp.]|jgi:hypothetical protein|uniref:hypothetical protein n=1 Tax=Sandarakinorhabdus sp. TaxID=1916663 RepID=UPI0028B25BEF|nr:hypothetical protein [Sandarakinorhabdus sp.]
MKLIIALALAALPAAALAQPSATPAAPAAAATLDTPIEVLIAAEKTKAILDARVPGLTSHPMFDQFKTMSLKQLQPMAGGQLTDAMLEAVSADLASGK